MVKSASKEEKEIKFIIKSGTSEKSLTAFLKSLNLCLDHQVSQTDIYFDNTNCDIINLKRGLRARYIDDKQVDFEFKSLFKGDKGNYVVEEAKLFTDGKVDELALRNILVHRLGIGVEHIHELSPVVTIKKDRQVFTDTEKTIEVSFDKVVGVGAFVEVESTSSVIKKFDEIVSKLRASNFAIADDSHAGYLDLILKENPKIRSKSDFENLFAKNNRWNVMPNELDIFFTLTN